MSRTAPTSVNSTNISNAPDLIFYSPQHTLTHIHTHANGHLSQNLWSFARSCVLECHILVWLRTMCVVFVLVDNVICFLSDLPGLFFHPEGYSNRWM